LAEEKVPIVKGKERMQLVFGKPGPFPMDPKVILPALEGPPFLFQMSIDDGKNDPLDTNFKVLFREPREYVEVTYRKYDLVKNKVHVKVKATKDFSGPPIPVRLVLPEDSNPGLNPKN